MAATAEEYNRKYHEEMNKINTTRDEAVRRTNIALGYGNSTALQHPVTDDPPAQPKD